MPSETLRSFTVPTVETSTLYFHQTNRIYGGTIGYGDPPVAGHVITVTASKKDDFCTVTIDMSRNDGIYFNYHPNHNGAGHISIATLPVGYRPSTTVYAIGQSTTTNLDSQGSNSWGGFQIGTNGKIYQFCAVDMYDFDGGPMLNMKRVFGIANYTVSGEDYNADGLAP